MSEVVYVMISVAAERAGMHPQTLRVYEARGLVIPTRSSGNTRLYSPRDIVRLQRIQELSAAGINLTGVERILKLEERVVRLEGARTVERRELEAAERQIRQLRRQLVDALAQIETLMGR